MKGTAMKYALLLLAGLATPAWAETVLVAGATGRTGQALLKELAAQGYEVRALTRDVEDSKKEIGGPYEWVQTDIRIKAQVDAAFKDRKIDYVVSAIGSRAWIGMNSPQFVDYLGTKLLAEAGKAAGVKHMVVVSVGNIGPHKDVTQSPSFGYLEYWKVKGEDAVKRSGLGYTIVGPGGLTEQPSGQRPIRLTARVSYKSGQIAIGDAAMVAVDALKNPAARNKAFGIVSDDTLDKAAWKTELKKLTEEAPGLPPTVIDANSNTALEALDAAGAPIRRYLYTAYGTAIRGQEVAIPDSADAFCTLTNAANTFLNFFPRDRLWKIQMLHEDVRDMPAGGVITCHQIAVPR
jgi:nucleoside-diphosphate-sugar epimerase